MSYKKNKTSYNASRHCKPIVDFKFESEKDTAEVKEKKEDKDFAGIRVFEMFAGYGGASFALEKAGIPFKCVGYSEIDRHAIKCYEQNHPGITNYYDCKNIEIDWLPDFDLLTGGFPCQDVSITGKRDLSKGKTLLINDIFRIISKKKPKYLFLENVEGLLSMTSLWGSIRYTLRRLGYHISYKLMHSSDYGIPQYRPRIYIFCKREPFQFMESIFPEKEKLSMFLKDILEREPDKKYYYKEDQYKRRLNYPMNRPQNKINPIYHLHPKSKFNHKYEAFDINGICPTLTCIDTSDFNIDRPLRRITPRECFRLMGFLDDKINLEGLSDNQIFKLAGNGWDISLVSKIFRNIFRNYKQNGQDNKKAEKPADVPDKVRERDRDIASKS